MSSPLRKIKAGRGYGLLMLIGLLGAGFSFVAFESSQVFEQQRQLNKLTQIVHFQTSQIQANLNLIEQTIRSQSAYIGALSLIRKQAFDTYTRSIIKHPAVSNVMWVAKIAHMERKTHEKSLRLQGLTDFRILDKSYSKKFIEAGNRREYYPIDYTHAEQKELPIGFDIASNELWKKAFYQSTDSGSPTFVGQSGERFQYVFQPVYHAGLPETKAAKRANLRGFVFVQIDFNKLLQRMKITLNENDVEFVLSRPTNDGNKVISASDSVTGDALLPDIQLHFSQVYWNLTFQGQGSGFGWVPWLVLVIGCIVTGLIVLFVLSLMRRTRQVEILVDERTAELKESEAQLVQSEKMASMGQMVAGIIHEINTPLAYVRSSLEISQNNLSDLSDTLTCCEGLVQSLDKANLSEKAKDQLSDVMEHLEELEEDETLDETHQLLGGGLKGMDNISSLVLNLKNFSRLDRAANSEHNLNQGLDQALSMVKHMLPTKIRIEKNYSDLPAFYCSPSQINQVFLNFLGNAIHAMEDLTDRDAHLQISSILNNDRIEIHIKDNGKGIAKKDREQIYQPFFTTKRSGKGTGLGLAICKKIIDEHDGYVSLSSEVGKGTHFILSFPVTLSVTPS